MFKNKRIIQGLSLFNVLSVYYAIKFYATLFQFLSLKIMVGLRKAGVLLNGLYRKKIGLTSGATSTLRRCQSEDVGRTRFPRTSI